MLSKDMGKDMSKDITKGTFSKFKDKAFRLYQQQAIEFALESSRRVVVVSAPMGIGKSLVGMCIGQAVGNMTYIVHSKALQDQLINDFPEAEALKGRGNYMCLRKPELTADHCIHSKLTPCIYINECPYKLQKKIVFAHNLRILNYDAFLAHANLTTFPMSNVIVCDEGDMLDRALESFVSLSLSRRLREQFRMELPERRTVEGKDGVAPWVSWGKMFKQKVADKIRKLQQDGGDRQGNRLDRLDRQDRQDKQDTGELERLMELARMRRLSSRLSLFMDALDDSWIMEETKDSGTVNIGTVTFKPTWIVPSISKEYFWRHGEKFVLMSATMYPPQVLSKLLGVPVGDIDYLSLPSPFPVEQRPIYLRPVADMAYKTFEDSLPVLIAAIKNIMDRYPQHKGLIHCVSFRLRDAIINSIGGTNSMGNSMGNSNSMGSSRLLTHGTEDRAEILEAFKNSSEPLVLVSPSYERGIDLKDDLARFIIWAKAPFLNLSDKQVSKRLYSGHMGQHWYRTSCANTIVQGSGRGVRHEQDWCDTYLLDTQIARLIRDYPALFAAWWKEGLSL